MTSSSRPFRIRPASPARLARLATASLGALVLFTPSFAQAAWDQGKATEIAKQLSSTAEKFYNDMYEASPQSLGMPAAMEGGDAHYEFLDRLRLLRSETRELADELAKGEGAKKTKPVYERIGELNRDLIEYSTELMLDEPVPSDMAKFESLVKQLGSYYAD